MALTAAAARKMHRCTNRGDGCDGEEAGYMIQRVWSVWVIKKTKHPLYRFRCRVYIIPKLCLVLIYLWQ